MQSCRDVAYLISSDGFEHAGWPTPSLPTYVRHGARKELE